MNIHQKMPMVKKNLDWIIDHDDSTEKNVANAVSELHAYIDARWEQAKARRAEKAQQQFTR
jgi:predicted Ser/Thr protein kinase